MREKVKLIDMNKIQLLEYIEKLSPYCDNCKFQDNDEDGNCDECHRKYFNWEHYIINGRQPY